MEFLLAACLGAEVGVRVRDLLARGTVGRRRLEVDAWRPRPAPGTRPTSRSTARQRSTVSARQREGGAVAVGPPDDGQHVAQRRAQLDRPRARTRPRPVPTRGGRAAASRARRGARPPAASAGRVERHDMVEPGRDPVGIGGRVLGELDPAGAQPLGPEHVRAASPPGGVASATRIEHRLAGRHETGDGRDLDASLRGRPRRRPTTAAARMPFTCGQRLGAVDDRGDRPHEHLRGRRAVPLVAREPVGDVEAAAARAARPPPARGRTRRRRSGTRPARPPCAGAGPRRSAPPGGARRPARAASRPGSRGRTARAGRARRPARATSRPARARRRCAAVRWRSASSRCVAGVLGQRRGERLDVDPSAS